MRTKTRGWFEQGLKDGWEVASQNGRNRSPRKTEQPKQGPSARWGEGCKLPAMAPMANSVSSVVRKPHGTQPKFGPCICLVE